MTLECALCTDLIDSLDFAIPIKTNSNTIKMVICKTCFKEWLNND